jgi:hypothetical protein
MRRFIFSAATAGAALALAACSGGATNNVAANDLSENMVSEAPANDASAMEAAGNATEAPVTNIAAQDSGRDSGDSGNNVESNVSGM